MELCDMCGKPLKGGTTMGGAFVCRICSVDLRGEMDKLFAKGKPVHGLKIARQIYRETYVGGNYLFRDIPDDLWNKAKHRAVDDGDSLRDLILKALYTYLK